MHRLTNRHILIGITGGIAAYKAAELTRLFKGVGAEVRVVLTDAGAEFITPLTLQALSGNPVHQSLLDPEAEQGMGHIELARWADLIIVAPATADFMARFAGGMANDLLTTLCLATDAPIALAPAMNQAMWRDPRTQQNLETLLSQGVNIFGPGSGEQACGDTGPGRMIEPTDILASCANLIANGPLNEKSVVITAGPTREAIDPVRFISNHSSGKMGFELASAAAKAGANVTLIAGPVSLPTPKGVRRVDVESAEQMLGAALIASEQADIFIGAAAVADYRPQLVAEQKIKKGAEEVMEILLTKNPDIIATIAAQPERPLMIGFAAETENLVEYARSKLVRKGLDLVIANDVSQADIGFNADQNEVILVGPNGELPLPKAGKSELAEQLISHISQLMD
ncbi:MULTISPECIES: bifunctional phosphopantothenoylcysteine decarboxylase/phosphopantothenate--cysteine ligase CoaBC [unclassified Marinobacterium]|uniref:bifunctional phosphopantothenoylcysteine decarboxylase/phosphopantothenate--cysteine ligase CoaBC n=1 Tax=unclassified Marinobacterium TaxID=2644139 RepID=UPI0015680E40|nr:MULTISPECIES: bifunctional phosphopantothenoylcysteine decarboxylase/phosphopantothenate--cysteine ligase CoaBC [unclassified Marinobacterium]NRP27405.1 Coenzyme A biosynthesis bifunctional protein CoaBC [Marinobacterium sp. xm-d-420]NRP46644.1 Coenzyme A biosynthesis bifunctional protein CoaBC [Marinobacterium sp. xm-d-543]NRQ23201.1 Coenzyme A biosynthesis bifunctional protein CoaBC [Marinobacterium sp. xm-m-312]